MKKMIQYGLDDKEIQEALLEYIAKKVGDEKIPFSYKIRVQDSNGKMVAYTDTISEEVGS